MLDVIPYCGTPPLPGELLARFNLDPVLIAVLMLLGGLHVGYLWRGYLRHGPLAVPVIAGWIVAALAFISPLCALSVALFSARIAQHMILMLIAAPLIALGLPPRAQRRDTRLLWLAACAFLIFLWMWHMPLPYTATFYSTAIYWSMHVTLFGSAIMLWREILHPTDAHALEALALGALSSMQMGMLGAILTLATHPMFFPHLTTTQAWGFTPLQDQQLGGVLMWVPGIVLFLWAALRSLRRLWNHLERPRPA